MASGRTVPEVWLHRDQLQTVLQGRRENPQRQGEREEPDQGKQNTLRWDKTSCHKSDANHARLKMGLLAKNLLHLLGEFYLKGEVVKRSGEWLIRRVVKVASRVSYHSRYWWVHVASAFPLRHHYQAVLGHG